MSSASFQAQSLLDIARQYLKSDEAVLLSFDRNTLRIQKEVDKEEPDIRLMERLIISDPALTSQVLRTANSAFFKGLSKVETIRDALVRLGAAEVANIVALNAHGRHYRTKDATLGRFFPALWRHSAGTALASRWIARRAGLPEFVQQAFIAGLLHDVGKLFLLTVLKKVKEEGGIRSYPADQVIMELMEGLHEELGSELLRQWELPEVYFRAALEHHKEDLDPKEGLLMIVKLSNLACNKKGLGLSSDPGLLLAATPEAHHLNLSEVALAELEIKLEDAFNL